MNFQFLNKEMEIFFRKLKEHSQNLGKMFRFDFSHLKTSTQISLKFTLFTMLQVLLFSLLANGIFFQNRYNRQAASIPPRPNAIMIQKMVLGKNRMPETEIFAINSTE